MKTNIDQAIELLERLGNSIGNGPIDPNNPKSLGLRCDAILRLRAAQHNIRAILIHIAETCIQDPDTASFAAQILTGSAYIPTMQGTHL